MEPAPAPSEGVPGEKPTKFTMADVQKRLGGLDWLGALDDFKRFNARKLYCGLMDGDDSGEADLQELAPAQAEAILKQVDADGDGFPDIIADMDPLTQMFWIATARVPPRVKMEHIQPPKKPAASHVDPVELPVVGILLPQAKHDEQVLGGGTVDAWMQMVKGTVRALSPFSPLCMCVCVRGLTVECADGYDLGLAAWP